MNNILVIIPCGQSKIWDKYPLSGPTRAGECYTGAPFKVNKEYAKIYGDSWVILSAKYGVIKPNFIIPESYNVNFKKRATNPISLGQLKKQVAEMGLADYEVIIGLGGKEYRYMIERVFADTNATTKFPFAGLPIGKAMQALRRSIESGKLYD